MKSGTSSQSNSSELAEEKLSEIMQRWEHGERLQDIRKDYGISYGEILRQTHPYRKGKNSGGKLSIADIRKAMERKEQGELLGAIAADLNVSRLTLRNGIKHVEAHTQPPQRILLISPRLMAALVRFENGEPLANVAKTYGVSMNKLRSLLIYECWRRGDAIEAVAKRFGISKYAVRERIVKHKQQEQF